VKFIVYFSAVLLPLLCYSFWRYRKAIMSVR